jgi:hypothetical protein
VSPVRLHLLQERDIHYDEAGSVYGHRVGVNPALFFVVRSPFSSHTFFVLLHPSTASLGCCPALSPRLSSLRHFLLPAVLNEIRCSVIWLTRDAMWYLCRKSRHGIALQAFGEATCSMDVTKNRCGRRQAGKGSLCKSAASQRCSSRKQRRLARCLCDATTLQVESVLRQIEVAGTAGTFWVFQRASHL